MLKVSFNSKEKLSNVEKAANLAPAKIHQLAMNVSVDSTLMVASVNDVKLAVKLVLMQ